jgi:hypothetical protein
MENLRNRLAVVTGLVGVLMLTGIGAANAQTADPVEGAFTTLDGKITLYGGLIVGLVIASVVLFFGIKWLRKGANKA